MAFQDQTRLMLLSLLFVLGGCGEDDSGGVKFGSATGTVTYNGAPLPSAQVMAFPEKGPLAIGTTDDAGKFKLFTGSRERVAVGNINVSITVGEPESASTSTTPVVGKTEGPQVASMTEMMSKYAENQRKNPEKKKTSPLQKYADAKTSGLSYTIKAGANELKIELK